MQQVFNDYVKTMESQLESKSHKGEKVCSYSVDFKLEVIRYAASHSIHAAAKKYRVDRNSIRQWRKKEEKMAELKDVTPGGSKQQRLDGAGRHITNENIEENLLAWIFERRNNGIRVSRKLLMIKATKLRDRIEEQNPAVEKLSFSAAWRG